MDFITECCLLEREKQQEAILESLEVDFTEGKTDFAFGMMPQQPLNPSYMEGWLTALRQNVIEANGVPVYPEGVYRAKATSNLNAAIFADIPFTEF